MMLNLVKVMTSNWAMLIGVLLFSTLLFGCDQPEIQKTKVIRANVLIEFSQNEPQWFRDVEVAEGTNGYELLEKVTQGDLKSDWYPKFNAHFVNSILGVANDSSRFWMIFIWNDQILKWEPLTVGADTFVVKNNNTLSWVRIDPDSASYKAPAHVP